MKVDKSIRAIAKSVLSKIEDDDFTTLPLTSFDSSISQDLYAQKMDKFGADKFEKNKAQVFGYVFSENMSPIDKKKDFYVIAMKDLDIIKFGSPGVTIHDTDFLKLPKIEISIIKKKPRTIADLKRKVLDPDMIITIGQLRKFILNSNISPTYIMQIGKADSLQSLSECCTKILEDEISIGPDAERKLSVPSYHALITLTYMIKMALVKK